MVPGFKILSLRCMAGAMAVQTPGYSGWGMGSASEPPVSLADASQVHREERGRLVIYRAAMESPLLREVMVWATLIELNPLVLRSSDLLRGQAAKTSSGTGLLMWIEIPSITPQATASAPIRPRGTQTPPFARS